MNLSCICINPKSSILQALGLFFNVEIPLQEVVIESPASLSTFTLFLLRTELRLQIWAHAIPDGTYIHSARHSKQQNYANEWFHAIDRCSDPDRIPSLLQITAESRSVALKYSYWFQRTFLQNFLLSLESFTLLDLGGWEEATRCQETEKPPRGNISYSTLREVVSPGVFRPDRLVRMSEEELNSDDLYRRRLKSYVEQPACHWVKLGNKPLELKVMAYPYPVHMEVKKVGRGESGEIKDCGRKMERDDCVTNKEKKKTDGVTSREQSQTLFATWEDFSQVSRGENSSKLEAAPLIFANSS